MAGNYADVPGHRMAYDRDGSQLLFLDLGNSSVITDYGAGSTTHQAWNNEGSGTNALGTNTDVRHYAACLIFPELRDIVGLWWRYYAQGGTAAPYFQTSVDTTTGIDGTWVEQTRAGHTTSSAKASMRNDIGAVSYTGIKAFRVGKSTGNFDADWAVYQMHVYGSPAAGAASNRLRFWHPTTDAEVGGAYFDWGDRPRNTTIDRDFRVKNPSTTRTAQSVTLSNEALTDTTPTNASAHTFSVGGGPFTSSLNIGDLAPGAISPVVTVRRTTPPDAALSLWWTRMVASAAAGV